ncbi:hypothetical protein [Alsobacter soli]|uniref:hypothetical protein n=1 Tax=Alsobacter soli TaxID=2109933 RepID=UPI0011B211D7|nr:hypothetical protein [Alsobacter soli]
MTVTMALEASMTVLSATALENDPEGMTLLRAVLASSAGYESRRSAAARRSFVVTEPGPARVGAASLRRRSLPMPALRHA